MMHNDIKTHRTSFIIKGGPGWERLWLGGPRPCRNAPSRDLIFEAFADIVFIRPPAEERKNPKKSAQWFVKCQTDKCLWAQPQAQFLRNRIRLCERCRYGEFDGHLLRMSYQRVLRHRLVKIVKREYGQTSVYDWHFACQTHGCSKTVCINNRNHINRSYCKKCSYRAEGRKNRPAEDRKLKPYSAAEIAAIVAYEKHIGSDGRRLWRPLMHCMGLQCENLVWFSRPRLANKKGLCPSCLAKVNRKRPFESRYNAVKKSAKQRGLAFEIEYDDFCHLHDYPHCFYCHCKIDVSPWSKIRRAGMHPASSGLDRKDNEIGYTKDNTVLCCGLCNLTKFRFVDWSEMLLLGALRRGDVAAGHALIKKHANRITEHLQHLTSRPLVAKRRVGQITPAASENQADLLPKSEMLTSTSPGVALTR